MSQPIVCSDGSSAPECLQATSTVLHQSGSFLAEASFELFATFAVFLIFWVGRSRKRPRDTPKTLDTLPRPVVKPKAGQADSIAAAPLVPRSPPRSPGALERSPGNKLSYALMSAAKDPNDLRAVVMDARARGVVVTTAHTMSVLKSLVRARRFGEGLAAYDALKDLVDIHGGDVFSIALFCAVEVGESRRCPGLFEELVARQAPSGNDFVNIVRAAVKLEDASALRRVLEQLHSISFVPDVVTRNRALASCAEFGSVAMAQLLADNAAASAEGLDVVGYNTLIKTYAQAGQLQRCFEILEEMAARGIRKSEPTYGILLDACVSSGAIDRAKELFVELKKSDNKANRIHYTTFIKGLTSAGRMEDAKQLFSEMRISADVAPDVIAYSTLMKALCDAGELQNAVELLAQMSTDGVKPDAIIFQSLFMGLHASSSNPELVFQVFGILKQDGPRPTASILSIFLKCATESGMLGEALDALDSVLQSDGKKPEVRLYVQLAWAFIRNRWGAKVLEVYQAMARASENRAEPISQGTHDQLVLRCAQCGMLQTAADLYRALRRSGGNMSQGAAKSVIALAAKKDKAHLFEGIVEVCSEKGEPAMASKAREWHATPGLSKGGYSIMAPSRRL